MTLAKSSTKRPRARPTPASSSWVRAPLASAMTVRLALELTGKPPTNDEPTLAAPRARNSWLLWTRWRWRPAKTRAVRMLSVYADDEDAECRQQHQRQSRRSISGEAERRSVDRDVADRGDAVVRSRSKNATTAVASEHDDERHGEPREPRRAAQEERRRDAEPIATVGQEIAAARRVGDERLRSSSTNVSPADVDAGDLAELAGDHDDARRRPCSPRAPASTAGRR